MKGFHICISILLPIEIFHNWDEIIIIFISNAGSSFYLKYFLFLQKITIDFILTVYYAIFAVIYKSSAQNNETNFAAN